ncbi:MAG: phytanoyl-CoA dioxygenase family protein [Acidobacteria bacterium]|nr:phytanoyl-CoA dioxygenase family protein [Acidobacteriota bacterium]
MEDLSKYHHPIGQLLSTNHRHQSTVGPALSANQIAFFEEHGFLSGIKILSDTQVDILLAELERLMDPSSPGKELFYELHYNESLDRSKTLFHALGAWRIEPGFHDLLWNPAFLAPAAQLLGGPVRFWHDQLFCKPAYDGGVVAWHQDYSYWTRTSPLAHLTCWIGLDDSNRDNGCLQYIPGSHRWPDLPVTGLTGEMNSIQRVLTAEQQKLFRPVHVELRRGECSFHHARTIHGSDANFTPQPRRATVINIFQDGVKSATDEPLLNGVPVFPRGVKLDGQFFPLLT